MRVFLFSNYNPASVAYYVKRALEKITNDLLCFSSKIIEPGWIKCANDIDIAELIDTIERKPDLLLLIECNSPPFLLPKNLNKVNIPSAWWAIDNHLNSRWHKEYANYFDFTFFAQKEYVPSAKQYGIKNIKWLPLACDPVIHKDHSVERIYDVGFVGYLNSEREKYFSNLNKHVNVKIFQGLNPSEMSEVYSKSKIGINICAREDLNMRTFEVMSSGAMLLMQKIDAGISDLFIENEHFVFHDLDNTADQIKKYLADSEERNRISELGKAFVQREHTYVHRIRQIIDTIFNRDSSAQKVSDEDYKLYVRLGLTYGKLKHASEAKKFFRQAKKMNAVKYYLYRLKYLLFYFIEKYRKAKKVKF